MKTIIKIVVVLAILGACKEEDTTEIKPGDTATLQLGESVVLDLGIEQWKITFHDIKENSLCPADVLCIWSGRFVAELLINNSPREIGYGDLSNTGVSNIVSSKDIRINLKNVIALLGQELVEIELLFESAS